MNGDNRVVMNHNKGPDDPPIVRYMIAGNPAREQTVITNRDDFRQHRAGFVDAAARPVKTKWRKLERLQALTSVWICRRSAQVAVATSYAQIGLP